MKLTLGFQERVEQEIDQETAILWAVKLAPVCKEDRILYWNIKVLGKYFVYMFLLLLLFFNLQQPRSQGVFEYDDSETFKNG